MHGKRPRTVLAAFLGGTEERRDGGPGIRLCPFRKGQVFWALERLHAEAQETNAFVGYCVDE